MYFYLLSKLFDVLPWECGLACAILYSNGRTPWEIRFANPDPGCLVNSDLDLDSLYDSHN